SSWASGAFPLAAFAYETLAAKDNGSEATDGNGRIATWRPRLAELWLDATETSVLAVLAMPEVSGAPKQVFLNVSLGHSGGKSSDVLQLHFELSLVGKWPTVLPEASASVFSFLLDPEMLLSQERAAQGTQRLPGLPLWIQMQMHQGMHQATAQRLAAGRSRINGQGSTAKSMKADVSQGSAWRLLKLGAQVDPEQVVTGGAQCCHQVWGGAKARTRAGLFQLESLDAGGFFLLPKHLSAAQIEEQWHRALARKGRDGKAGLSLARVLFGAFGWRYGMFLVIFSVWLGSLSFVPALAKEMFAWLSMEDTDANKSLGMGLGLSFALVASYLVNCNSACQMYQQTTQLGYEFRATAAQLVFRKLLRLPVSAREQAMNLIQVDAERLYIFAQLNHLPVTAVLVILVASGYLVDYESLELSAVAITIVLSTVAIQALAMRVAMPARRKMQRLADERVAMLAELLDGIKVLKMYGWVDHLTQRLRILRSKELGAAASYLVLRSLSSGISYCSPIITMVVLLLMLRSRGQFIDPQRVFLIFTVVGLARAPLGGVAMGSSAIVDGCTALRRLQGFLVRDGSMDVFEDDLLPTPDETSTVLGFGSNESTSSPDSNRNTMAGDDLVCVVGEFGHSDDRLDSVRTEGGAGGEGASFRLSTNLTLHAGELLAISGRVASGKTSLLLAVLGELRPLDAETQLRLASERVAYLAQTPWLRGGTVRDAVVQDLPWDERSFWKALNAAQLQVDLRLWDEGDRKVIGARGAGLSGGQHSRVGIAHLCYRCLVSRIDIVLVDDCLAALDSHVANAAAQQALLGIVADGRRAVIVAGSSNLILWAAASRIFHLQDGELLPQNTSSERGNMPTKSLQPSEPDMPGSEILIEVDELQPSETDVDGLEILTRVDETLRLGQTDVAATATKETKPNKSSGTRTLIYYFGAGAGSLIGGLALFGVSVMVLVVEGCKIQSDRLMGQWAETASSAVDEEQNGFQLFLIWASVAMILAMVRALAFVALGIRASRRLHDRLLTRLVAAPVGFFGTLPAGTVLNHFSKDLDSLDTLLPQAALDFAQDLALMVGIVVVIVVTTPMAALAVAPVLAAFFAVRTFFSRTARQAKRLDSGSRAPLYALTAEVADGLATLRAHCQSGSLCQEFARRLDWNGRAFFQTYILQPWCILVLDSLGATIVCITTVSCVLLAATLSASASTMAVSYSLMARGKLQFCVRLSVEAENQLIAVERLQCFEAKIPSEEAPMQHPHGQQRIDWPTVGAISFSAVQLRYQPGLPLVLRSLDLEIPAGCKFGLAGRSGSGKSSLLSAVLRLVDVECGCIRIDSVDVRDMPLQALRAAISIIPQDPTLWSGSLADNLDPSSKVPAEELARAVESVGLGHLLGEGNQGLVASVGVRGENLSQGQRQMLCIARCILRNSCIVLIDEATASLDVQTDEEIQECLRKHLAGRTKLVVAHRLHTLMDADLVAVLDAGVVVESGSPIQLKADPCSRFAALAATMCGPGKGTEDMDVTAQPLMSI
ncbi:unnamed protein product, partial [Polarella glacialis]